MTDRATQLREALDSWYSDLTGFDGLDTMTDEAFQAIIDAARAVALPILEGDEGLAERIASTIADAKDWDGLAEIVKEAFRADARRVLAALIPTEGEGE